MSVKCIRSSVIFIWFCMIGRVYVSTFNCNVSGYSLYSLMKLKEIFRKIHFWQISKGKLYSSLPLNSKSFLRSWWVIYKEKKEILILSSIPFYTCVFTLPLKLQKNGGPSDLVALYIEEIIRLVTFDLMRNENRLVTLLFLVGRKIFRFLVPSWKAENAFAFSGLLLILGN